METLKQLCKWRVVAASVRGTGHEQGGQLCQDAHHWEMLPEGILVAAVADGAGSASLGKVGAIVAAQTAVETIRSSCRDAPWCVSTARSLLGDALEAAKTAVEAEAAACRTAAQNLATTLIVAIASPDSIATAQVGDGVAVAEDSAGNLLALTTPQSGEYINETTFLTSPQALDKAQVKLWHGSAANLALLTDGLQMLALEMTEGMPHRPFFSPLFNFVADVTDETAAREQLVAFLRSERITRRTDDDLTLLLATLL